MAEILDAPSCVSIPHPHATPHWRSHAQAGEGQSDGLDRLAAAVGGLETSSAWTAPPPFPQAVLAEAAAAQAAHALVSAAAGARRHRPGCTAEMGMALRQRRQRLDHLEPQPNQEDSAGLAAPLCAVPGTARWHRPHACARTDRANPRSPPPPPTAPPAPPSPPPVVPISLAIESPPGSPVLCAVKRPWSAEEDERLVQMVQSGGAGRWAALAQNIPGRVGKQCRERWHNHLCPGIRKGSFTEEEDRAILEAVARHGTRWAQVVKYLPGRTDNAVKNRWNSVTRKLTPAARPRVRKRAAELGASLLEISPFGAKKKPALGSGVAAALEGDTAAEDGCVSLPHNAAAPQADRIDAPAGARGEGRCHTLLLSPPRTQALPLVQSQTHPCAGVATGVEARRLALATAQVQPGETRDVLPARDQLRTPQAEPQQMAQFPPPANLVPSPADISPLPAASPPPARFFPPPADSPRCVTAPFPTGLFHEGSAPQRTPLRNLTARPRALLPSGPPQAARPPHPDPALTVLDPSDQPGRWLPRVGHEPLAVLDPSDQLSRWPPRFGHVPVHASRLARYLLTHDPRHAHSRPSLRDAPDGVRVAAGSEASAHTPASSLAAVPSFPAYPTAAACGHATDPDRAASRASPEAYDDDTYERGVLGVGTADSRNIPRRCRAPDAAGLGLLSWLSSLPSHPPHARPSPPAIRAAVALANQLAPSSPLLAPSGPLLAPSGPLLAPSGPLLAPSSPLLAPDGPLLAPDGPLLALNASAIPDPSPADCAPGLSPAACEAPPSVCLTHRAASPALQHSQLAAAAAAVAEATTHADPPAAAPSPRHSRRRCLTPRHLDV